MVASKAAAQDLMTAVTTTVLLRLVMAMARLRAGDRAWAARRVRAYTCAFTAFTAFQPVSLDCNEPLNDLCLGQHHGLMGRVEDTVRLTVARVATGLAQDTVDRATEVQLEILALLNSI